MKYIMFARALRLTCEWLVFVTSVNRRTEGTHALQLLEYATMQVLVHVSVLERIMCCFLRRSRRGIQVLELACEAHSHFEWIGHFERCCGGIEDT